MQVGPWGASIGSSSRMPTASWACFFVTSAQGEFRSVRRDVDRLRRVPVGDRSAYCGVHGAPMLFVPLGQGRMLSVTAQCEVAKSFARFAVPRLDG